MSPLPVRPGVTVVYALEMDRQTSNRISLSCSVAVFLLVGSSTFSLPLWLEIGLRVIGAAFLAMAVSIFVRHRRKFLAQHANSDASP